MNARLLLTALLISITAVHARAQPPSQSVQSLSDAIAKSMARSSDSKPNDGPRIDRYVLRSGRVEIEKVTYPAPAGDQKVIVIRLPESDDRRIDLDSFQVGITFTVQRLADACNTTNYQGGVEEQNCESAQYFLLTYRPGKVSRTLKGCMQTEKAMRTVEIVTELAALRPFQNNLVFYVPQDVDVTAHVWKRARVIQGIAP